MRNLTKALTVVSLLAPVSGHSLGIGDIRVRSALNQNLSAEISLVASRGENPSNIKVSLAPAEKFDEAGVPWSYFLSKIRFQPIVKPNGSMVIKVTSREALKEPYLNFLLEVSWPKGNLYREFTVLVDPPAEYQAPTYQERAYQEPAYPLTSKYENYPPQQQEYAPRQRRVRHTAKPRRSSAGSYGGQITTRRNDTLWNVAERARGAGVSVEQMMIAMYEKNPHAFFQQNVNALSAGKTLRVPDKNVVQQTSRQEALAEFGRQNDAWNNNRSGIPAGQTQLAKEDEVDSQLKLVAPTDATVGQNEAVSPSSEQAAGNSNTASPDRQAAADKESTKATAAPVDDALQSKVAALEKQMAMMQELIVLKDKQLAALQNPAQTQATPTQTQAPAQVTPPTSVKPEHLTPVTPEKPLKAAATPKPIQPITAPKPVVKPINKIVQPEPIPQQSDSSYLWLVGVVGTALLSLFGWLWWRKKKLIEETNADSMFGNYSAMRNSGSTSILSSGKGGSGVASTTISGESSFLNDFKASDFESFESFNVDHGDIDPVAEADVYLAYGRYQQAEDLIKQAITDSPDRDECKLKLLEIFQGSSSKDAFESYARELADAGKNRDTAFWGKVIELSKGISSDSELFSSPIMSSAAVFAAKSEALTENVLFNSSAGKDTNIKSTDNAEYLGVATFEIPDDDDVEESLFDPTYEELISQNPDEPVDEIAENQDNETDFNLDSFEDSFGGQQDNESIDFDLGPYPETTKKVETKNTSFTLGEMGEHSSSSQLEGKGEVESYEFDFNLDKAEGNKPARTEKTQENNSWNPDQTVDFAVDELPEADTFGNDTIDFNFDFESPQTGFDKQSSQDQGFKVSDLTDMDEMETKLDLAKAYMDMGDADSAKEIIEQVLEKGSAEQKKTAQELLDDLSLG
ncbi:FimV/HubP family polar landmark protein [Methyloglobulus sp.]|uniref:FimV/HubP family polar landmark protein n=1 Tax=Methyloglobulus sp. TaxID=2518622 RepID=UPI0032B7FE51